MNPPGTIVVLRFSALGDVVLTSTVFDVLAREWPQARCVLVTKAAIAPVMRGQPNVHEVVALAPGESAWSLRRRVAALAPDAVLDLHGKLRSRVVRSVVPRHQRGHWRARPWTQSLAVRWGIQPYRPSLTMAARYHVALEELARRPLEPGRLRLTVAEELTHWAEQHLAAAGIGSQDRVLGLAPGAAWATKRWPVERYGALAQRALAYGLRVIVLGGPGEEPLLHAVRRVAPAVSVMGPELDVQQLTGLVARCHGVVANDSGPMHVARAVGVPTVALFGSTSWAQFDFTGHARVAAEVACSPCSLYGRAQCPRGHFRCMNDIQMEHVWGTLRPLLGTRPLWVHG